MEANGRLEELNEQASVGRAGEGDWREDSRCKGHGRC